MRGDIQASGLKGHYLKGIEAPVSVAGEKPKDPPFGIVQQDEHTSTLVILKAFVVMAVGIADQVVKDSGVDDVQEAWARVIWRCLLHCIAVALIILPP